MPFEDSVAVLASPHTFETPFCRIEKSDGFCVPGKRYNLADVSAAFCMSLGLIWFTLADSKVAPNFNVTGT